MRKRGAFLFFLSKTENMKTENELNSDILKITMRIEEIFPELSKYIAEMPFKISNSLGVAINRNDLKDYCNSLNELFNNYSTEHGIATK